MKWSYLGQGEPSQKLLAELLEAPPGLVAVDVETVSIKDKTPVGLSIATRPDEAFYWPIDSTLLPWHILNNRRITKVYHNALFDLEVLLTYTREKIGLPIVDTENIGDTAVMANLLSLPRKLSTLAPHVGAHCRDMGEILGKAKTTEHLPQEVIAMKCCEDTTATMALYQELRDDLDWQYYLDEVALIPVLLRMTIGGIKIDQELRATMQEELEREVHVYKVLAEGMGFNPGSPQQVAYMLAKDGEHLPRRRGRVTTSKEVLRDMDSPIAALVLNYRAASKSLSTYIKPLEGKDRAYSRFHMNAVTGRISSASTNLQNIPKKLRAIYMPDYEVFTDWDYSQIELRILAHLAGDRMMQAIYEYGGDIHQATADALGIPRNPTSKNTNFAMIYGATASTVAETAHVPLHRAQWLLQRWFETYPDAGRWIQELQQQGLRDGYIVTMGGRKIMLPTGDEDENANMRKAVSYKIQGSAAEIMKAAIRRCSSLPIVLQIYDQLLFNGRVELPLGLDRLAKGLHTPIDIKETVRWE